MSGSGIDESQIPNDPYELFRQWWAQAQAESGMKEPSGMSLATADAQGRPSNRIVLLKHWDRRGFVFYSNYTSRKARELHENPHGALLFWWDKLRRQIRVCGQVEKVAERESDAYFAGRPRGSQLGAWASQQSRPLDSPDTLSKRVAQLDEEFGNDPIPRPPHWGGYRLIPREIEFWDDGAFRLHDRIVYLKDGEHWQIQRLYP
ncbi:pyridoxamine 5'-phosphate oxidase [Natronospira proteinivora]|uniref:Pyridoxine/pyridoxamine 5'-phosphate oxidase n=1 Tax=Natronospira proteinivora TaxID=1807133 RepID=A0ABT1G606_9GAMM|nr:pyridoxamine 5'-phosphate oxidase [Natronospira proteinivora]MCP1726370.1 pyridoxamine 5'-phosphate oxidase [Natronospira proteinivora]